MQPSQPKPKGERTNGGKSQGQRGQSVRLVYILAGRCDTTRHLNSCTLLLRTWIEDEGGEDVDSDPAHCLNFVSMSGF
ncbi:hypothetical protein BDBG_02957 [Blastomyces gilchristii SLH14081]|uniref:Uncharacterized protein n=1 Tax=Blastomyces gilchristii (strain SLH14081) TaxID=559298 RepID=A0A179UK64_BLAGS|nr:uncharacterized protein BDBG_02957 [Blastomyces gilchristii SLH14081]OAT06802.1 hypothetical protein BDBG_02957 [Blastomyces gilchristii SLH14081]